MILNLRQFITCFILGFPLIYIFPFAFTSGGRCELLYFLVELGCLLLILAKEFDGRVDIHRFSTVTVCFLLMFVSVVVNTTALRYTKPLSCLFYLVLLAWFAIRFRIRLRQNDCIIAFSLYIFFSLAVGFFPERTGVSGRVVGFASSPTTFATYIQVAFVMAFFSSKNSKLRWGMFIVTTALVALSKTRLNMIYQVAFLPMYFLYVSGWVRKSIIYFGFVICLIALYPVYDVYCGLTSSTVTLARYDDDNGDDKSFLLRIAMSKTLFEDLLDSGLAKGLVGHGSERAREIVKMTYGEDLLPHNDFLRIFYDYGAAGFIILLALCYAVAASSPLLFFLMLLYNVSFYHNMVFNYYLPSLVVLFLVSQQQGDRRSQCRAAA